KGALQSCNSAKAQGGIQAAFADDDSPEQHAEDVWKSSHETADRRLVEILTSEAPSAIHWLEELGVEFTRENGGYRLPRRGGAARQRFLPGGGRTRPPVTTAPPAAPRWPPHPTLPQVTARRARTDRERLARALRGSHDRRHDCGPRGGRAVLPRRAGAGRALDESPGCHRRGDADGRRPRR